MTTGWTVTFDVAHGQLDVDADRYDSMIDDLTDWLSSDSAVIAVAPARDRYSITLSVESDDDRGGAFEALAYRRLAEFAEKAGLPHAPIVRLNARTWEEHDAELAQPAYPELVGVAELAEMLHVSPQRASELQSRAGFPAPIAVLRSGPVWVRSHVQDFEQQWERRPGRPPKEPAIS
jgi:hypothetical protein